MRPVLLDTNVLIYAADTSDARKHRIAVDLLRALGETRTCITTQVLCEYASVMTHPAKMAVAVETVATSVRDMSMAWTVLQVDSDTVVTALGAKDRWQLPYFDAQVWASAALNSVPVVLSEDFSAGVSLGPVTFHDPVAADFDLAAV